MVEQADAYVLHEPAATAVFFAGVGCADGRACPPLPCGGTEGFFAGPSVVAGTSGAVAETGDVRAVLSADGGWKRCRPGCWALGSPVVEKSPPPRGPPRAWASISFIRTYWYFFRVWISVCVARG